MTTRIWWLIVLGVTAMVIVSMREPTQRPSPLRGAPLLEAFYARPLETVETHVLRRGETLHGLLVRAGIGGGELANLLLALREQHNPQRLVAGVEVTLRRWTSDGAPRSVEVRLNPDSTVRLARGPLGWASELQITPVTVDTVHVSGTIAEGGSLFEALVYDDELDLPPQERYQLVSQLADEIYGFTLDFSREIRPGDAYRLAYEREARPDGSARRRRILIAEIQNSGRAYSAVYFNPLGDGGGYYDLKGNSLRKAFRRSPLDYVRIVSSFSWRRYHPILGIYRAHLGTDFGAAYGTPVRATADGTVASAGWGGGYGNLIVLRHAGSYTTRYAHLGRFARGVRLGRRVAQNEVIGYVGSTGLSTGPHLHYELRRNEQPLNARTVSLPGAPPIPSELRDEFAEVVEQRLGLLERQASGPRLAAGQRSRVPVGGGI
ncbi:MAG: M23 family metallopeptidase [Gemmatimonadetes bacterium]|nr:M23 family metallopeptidase [Gemmatimonadota bacterium]